MATDYFTFTPQPTAPPFLFQPTLDGQDYLARVTWNVFGQRWYISLDTSNNQPVFMQAMVASPQLIEAQTIRWENGFAIIEAGFPSSFRIGQSFNLTVSGFVPDAYNTPRALALIIGPTEIMYPMATPAVPATVLGRATYDINLAGGYFTQSSLVFREATQQFEVFTP